MTCKFFLSLCQVLEIANVFTSVYHPPTNEQVERVNHTLTAMLRSYVIDHQQQWDAYDSTLLYAYNSKGHRFTINSLLDMALNCGIPDFTLDCQRLPEQCLPLPNNDLDF